MDIIRNVGIREPVPHGSSKITDTDINTLAMKLADSKLNRNSLPNILLKEPTPQRIANGNEAAAATKLIASPKPNVHVEANAIPQSKKPIESGRSSSGGGGGCGGIGDDDDEECAISGRLEIRVIQQQHQEMKNSPNREESIYFDAIANGQSADDAKVSRKLVNKIYATHTAERNRDATSELNCEQPTDETAFFSVPTTGRLLDTRDDGQKSSDVTRLNLSNNSNPISDGDNRVAGNNGPGLLANTVAMTDISSINDDNAADSFVTAGNTLAKFSNVIGSNQAFK